ncbi:syndecan [Biomphalaria glabrata]
MDTSNIEFDFDPPSSGFGPTDTDDEDLAGSGSGLSGSGDGPNYDTDVKTTPTTTSATTVNATTTSRPMSECEKASQTTKMVIGRYIPRCLPNGVYAPLQCQGEPKMSSCFCSDIAGKEIPGTMMDPPNYPDCEKGENLNPCVFQLVSYHRHHLVGSYYPKCSQDGQFEKVQCHENLCFCVDPETGKKQYGTESHSSNTMNCEGDSDIDLDLAVPIITPPPTETETPKTEEEKHDDDDDDDDDDERIDTNDNGVINIDQPGVNKHDETNENKSGTSEEEEINKKPETESRVEKATSEIMTQPGILAGIIGGSVVVLLCLVLLIMFVVYRMRKKDEGSYPLDEPRKTPNYSYVRAPEKEFYA